MAMTPYISADDFENFLTTVDAAMDEALRAEPQLAARFARSRAVMAEAGQELAGGNPVGPAFKIANTALTVAETYYMRTDQERARELLYIAVRLYGFRNQERYAASIAQCHENLAQLDALRPAATAPAATAPVQTSGPAESASQAPQGAPADASLPPASQAPPLPQQASAPPSVSAPRAVQPSSWRRSSFDFADDGDGDGQGQRNVTWEQLLEEWRGGGEGETPVENLLDTFAEHVTGMIGRNAPMAFKQLKPIIEKDLVLLREKLTGASVPTEVFVPLHERAKEVRQVASRTLYGFTRGGTAYDGQRIRLQWLATALHNLSLRVHLPENDHQIIADVLGYLQTLQVEYRYNNDRRELLLAVSEATTLVAVGELQVYHLSKIDFVCRWLRHAVGIQLLVAGPEPVEPGGMRAHRRVKNTALPGGYDNPETWAGELLRQWAGEPERWNSIAFILLLLSNWKAEGLERLLAALYYSKQNEASSGPETKDEVREFWRERALDMLGAARGVRVIRNAWEPGSAQGAASTSMSLTERDSVVQLPSRLLQGMAVELAPKTNGAVMQGALFADRPVPTFLASNVFGPIGVLKIDEAAKVQREKRNFDAYGELLHPAVRSSKCTVSTATVINSTNGGRYQGILTSYVFRNRDEPTTLRAWLVKTEGLEDKALRKMVKELFLEALGPWLSNASRAMGDLRGEYPALRPDDYERTGYAPGKDAGTELDHFEAPEVAEVFGVEGGLTWRPRTLGALFEGSSFAADPLFTDRDAELTNPLWLVAHIAEVARPGVDAGGAEEAGEDPSELLEWLLYNRDEGLTTRSYLTCVSHGDLHCENVLVGGTGREEPDLYLIDFETTHRGHICKDFARLESALWSRTFAWTPEQLAEIRPWFAEALRGESLWDPEIPEKADPEVRRVLTCVKRLRAILKGCEQPNWAFTDLEYRWALFASLLPFARYRDHETPSNRFLPFLLAAELAEGIVDDARKATGKATGRGA
ncbi:phosphotransferase [Streptomyces sp. NPDC101115]|uniref:aminoglycoside phosphotransferase family protein n=1 Tax=Streptomyces sp. NPDC101115 TaxID=3366106 RepID=UPI00382666EA